MTGPKDIHLDLILPHMKVTSRKQAFQILAKEAAALCGLPEKDILGRLTQQERQAGSGIGDGIAIPHLRFRRLKKPFILYARLDHAIEYDAIDGQPVDMICMMLAPVKDGPLNLQRLALISRLLRDSALRDRLREAQGKDALMAILTESGDMRQAA